MHISVVRFKSTDKSTLGKLFIDGEFKCFTLEDAHHDVKVPGKTRIPRGTYPLDLRQSPKFTPRYGHKMLWIKEVPGFEYVLLHKGNTVDDTEGCLLVGNGVAFLEARLINSTAAYESIYPMIAGAINSGKPVSITMIDFA